MYGVLGNFKGKVKPWYLPFNWVFCRISINYKTRVVIVKNSSVANIWSLPVEVVDGVVVGVWDEKRRTMRQGGHALGVSDSDGE